jgi:phosphoserine phosphatase
MKLLVLDVEGTLFRTVVRLPGTDMDSTIWQGIAQRLGERAVKEEVATHGRWRRGEYRDYLEWMKDSIQIHQRHGLTGTMFQGVIDAAEYNPGVPAALTRLDRSRYEVVLISGGFRELAARAQRDFRIIHAFAACEYMFGPNDSLDAFNLLPCDFRGKIDFIQLMLREYEIDPGDWIFVGDGANDVPIAQSARVSVGYRPHPRLREAVTHVIEDFTELSRYLS